MIYHPEIQRAKSGQCNICLNSVKLTWDHVPPKGGIKLKSIELRTIFQNIFEEKPKFKISQNGLKYRTLCGNCNNNILGKKYDPFLNDFVKSISNILKTKLILPKIIHLDLKPIPIIKSILGHILATKIDVTDTPFEKKIRPIVLDINCPIPDDLSIFYWVYPYTDTRVIRDVVMPKVRGSFKEFGMFHIFKFFPLAFLISDDVSVYQKLPSLSKYKKLKFNDYAKIPINLLNIMPRDWPEKVEEGNVVGFGKTGVGSIKAKPKKY